MDGKPVVGRVVTGGSFALMQAARELGYKELEGGYANKCHLCTHVRQFLFERGGLEAWVGPRECYASPTERAEAEREAQLVSSATAETPFVELTAGGQPTAHATGTAKLLPFDRPAGRKRGKPR